MRRRAREGSEVVGRFLSMLRVTNDSPAGYRPYNQKRFSPRCHSFWQRGVRGVMREITLARKESQKCTAFLGHVISNSSSKHRVRHFQCIEDRSLGDLTLDLDLNLLGNAGQRAQVCWEDHTDHASV